MSSDLLDGYWRAPPIARTVATAAFVTSISVYLGVLPAHWIVFWNEKVFAFPPQIWRFWTNFLLTGQGLGLLFDTYFLYNYTSALEVGNPRFSRREDVIWYLLFVGGVITILGSYLLGGGAFLSALILALCRTVTQDQRGMKASIYFVTIPAQLMPFAMMLMSLLFPGGAMTFLQQLCGFVAAHLFEFLTRIYPEFAGGRNLIPAPAFLSRFVETPRVFQRNFGTAIRPPPAAAAQRQAQGSSEAAGRATGSSAGMGSGPLPDSWRSRGPGRRLGD